MPLPLPLPGLGGGVLSQGGVVGVTPGGQRPATSRVVVFGAAVAGAGRAVVQGVRAVGAAGAQEEVGAAHQGAHQGVRVGGVGVGCQQLALGLQAGAAVPKVLSQTVQTGRADVHRPGEGGRQTGWGRVSLHYITKVWKWCSYDTTENTLHVGYILTCIALHTHTHTHLNLTITSHKHPIQSMK